MKRYSYHDEPLTPEEAEVIRAQQLESIQSEISGLSRDIAELNERFWDLKGSPLPETRRVQTTLNPGDPGYDEAPPVFDPAEYQGDVAWVNTSNEKQL
jgi:hypothetical protein